jgi:hypothetical protein
VIGEHLLGRDWWTLCKPIRKLDTGRQSANPIWNLLLVRLETLRSICNVEEERSSARNGYKKLAEGAMRDMNKPTKSRSHSHQFFLPRF